MKIDYVCSKCGNYLEVSTEKTNTEGHFNLVIEPCQNCIKDMEDYTHNDDIENSMQEYVDDIEDLEVEIKELSSKIDKFRKAFDNIILGGKWLEELERSQDVTFINMPLAYSKDCYRIAKNAVKI